jgi:large subunit ribosomal protein L9
MKVILLQDVENLGDEGTVVTVKDGYGRNFLIPRGLARVATEGAVKARQEEIRQASRKRAREKDQALEVARQLEDTEIVLPARVGEENRIFGTITTQQLTDELGRRGFDLDRRTVAFTEDIRMVGVYTATVKLHKDVTAQVKVRVVPQSQDAEA